MAEEALVNVYQARDILKVSLRTIYNMMNDGRLKRGERNPSMVTRESIHIQYALRGVGGSISRVSHPKV